MFSVAINIKSKHLPPLHRLHNRNLLHLQPHLQPHLNPHLLPADELVLLALTPLQVQDGVHLGFLLSHQLGSTLDQDLISSYLTLDPPGRCLVRLPLFLLDQPRCLLNILLGGDPPLTVPLQYQ